MTALSERGCRDKIIAAAYFYDIFSLFSADINKK